MSTLKVHQKILEISRNWRPYELFLREIKQKFVEKNALECRGIFKDSHAQSKGTADDVAITGIPALSTHCSPAIVIKDLHSLTVATLSDGRKSYAANGKA